MLEKTGVESPLIKIKSKGRPHSGAKDLKNEKN